MCVGLKSDLVCVPRDESKSRHLRFSSVFLNVMPVLQCAKLQKNLRSLVKSLDALHGITRKMIF